ncbi:Photosynthesis system II assembly factor YCF48 [Nannocystis exedens]|uniref:Photosynthesis system II assembly factor YCF48 n=1 Tax=Nannocystis exedens TaxID=54 RepID=A0A1I2BFJ2_9BACT|nr:YCF48-related protein [Nannocystis exedens]PCC68010.1 Ycf48-like protein [Nannocystis exedens]SFE54727.1 Photosynthesis system II assembly factor YCF48 [Nannocystis exedens]
MSPTRLTLLLFAGTVGFACHDPPNEHEEFCASDVVFRILFEVQDSEVDADLDAVARSGRTTAALTVDGRLAVADADGVLRYIDAQPAARLRHLAIAPAPCKPAHVCETAALLAVGDGGAAWRSVDGGRTYAALDLGITADLRHVEFVLPLVSPEPQVGIGFIVGDGVLLRSTDEGASWQPVALAAADAGSLHAVEGIDDWAYAVGDAGLVLESHDYGVTWTRLAHPFTDDLRRVHTDHHEALAIVTADGAVLLKDDAGALVRHEPQTPLVDVVPILDEGLLAAYADGRLGPWPESSGVAEAIELPALPRVLSPANSLLTVAGAGGSLAAVWTEDRKFACEAQPY